MKISTIPELYTILPENERLIVDILRQFIRSCLAKYGNEKISFNVPFYYGNKGICIIWPATIPRGGIKSGVLLGFWYGSKLKDKNCYLTHGTNKQIYYKIFESAEEIDFKNIRLLLQEAIQLDKMKNEYKRNKITHRA